MGKKKKKISQQSAKGTDQTNTLFCRYKSTCTTSKLTLLYELPANYSKLNAFASAHGTHSSPPSPTVAQMSFSKASSWCEVAATCGKYSPLHNSNSATSALPANKQQTLLKVTTKAFKIQVAGRRKQGEKRLKVLINCSLGWPKRKQL